MAAIDIDPFVLSSNQTFAYVRLTDTVENEYETRLTLATMRNSQARMTPR